MARTTALPGWSSARAQFLHSLLSDDYRPEHLSCLLWPRAHPPLMAERRNALILSRVRALSLVFAVLTLLWITIDAVTLPARTAALLALARVAASGAFFLLAGATRRVSSLRRVYGTLMAFYAVPTLFYFASLLLLHQAGMSRTAEVALHAYGVLPVVAMAGLGVFPLTIVETAIFAAPIVIGELLALRFHLGAFLPGGAADALWLLVLMAGIALVVAVSQLGFALALVGQSLQDRLTGCYSRASITELLELHFNVSARFGSPLAVAFVDLDEFKAINDQHGHDAGDRVLAEAASRIRAVLRGADCVGRWGGEEFLVVLPGKTAAAAMQCMETIRSRGLGLRPAGQALTGSVGVAERITDGCSAWPSLVRIADQRMYAAKGAGRNCIVGPLRERPSEPVLNAATLMHNCVHP